MKIAFETIDLQSPATYAEGSSLKQYFYSVAIAAAYDRHPETHTQYPTVAEFKSAFRAGLLPDVAREILRLAEEKTTAAEEMKAAAAAAAAALPDKIGNYQITSDAENIYISGKFSDELHARVKRAGGQWDGRDGNNTRCWVLPASKAATVKKFLSNQAKADSEREAEFTAAVAESARNSRERAEAADIAGKYGPVTVRRYGNREWAVAFRYAGGETWFDNLKNSIKSIGGKFDGGARQWFVDTSKTAQLQALIATAQAEYAQQQAQAQKREPAQTAPSYWDIDGVAVGDVVRLRGKLVKITRLGSKHRITDDDACAYGLEPGLDYYPTARQAFYEELAGDELAAAEEENNQEKQTQAQAEAVERERAQALQAARSEESKLQREVQAGERPDGQNTPNGEVFLDTFNIYGTGSRFVLEREWLWFVQNNGMDGDDWSRNNVRTGGAGAIGWRIPRQPEHEATLRRLQAALAEAIGRDRLYQAALRAGDYSE